MIPRWAPHAARNPDATAEAKLHVALAMSEPERGELAGRIAAESQDVIAQATKNGTFVLPMTTNIATAIV